MPSLIHLLSPSDVERLSQSAKQAAALEARWRAKLGSLFDAMTDQVIESLIKTGRVRESKIGFEGFLMDHSLEVMKASAMQAEDGFVPVTRDKASRMAAPPKAKIPRSLRDLMREWDKWRAKRKPTKRQKWLADRIKKAYLEKVQSVWRKYSEDFREGKTGENQVREYVERAAGAAYSRAKTIMETETTYYYNAVRMEIYDQSESVTHYLFVALRDHRTTKWCRTRQGLVYKKGSELLRREKPPCHFNCRSEILPLTPGQNARHRRIVEDESRWRENRHPAPLLKDWGSR